MKRLWLLVVSAASVSNAGCLMVDPGGQTRKALTQQNVFGWSTDEFNANTLGTHEAGFVMYEGPGLVLVLDDGGRVVVDPLASIVTAYLRVDPKADVAGAALVAMAQASTEQAAIFKEGFLDLAGMIAPLIGSAASAGDTSPGDVGTPVPSDQAFTRLRAAIKAALAGTVAPPPGEGA